MNNNFFTQHPQSLNLTEIGGFDVFGLPEIKTQHHGGGFFEIKTTITTKDVLDYLGQELHLHDSLGFSLPASPHLYVADLKEKKIVEDVEKLRLLVCESFSKQLEALNRPQHFFYVGKAATVVQFVYTPVSFYDWTPGDMSFSYSIFTERYLGILEEVEDE